MRPTITHKWRPPLGLVLGGVIATVLCAPIFGLFVAQWLSESMGYREASVIVTTGVLLVALILGWLVWRLFYNPVQALSDRALRVIEGDPSALAPMPHYGTRELQMLGQSVLDMATTLNDRESAIRTYSDHVTHELKTPLTTMGAAVEMLEDSDGLGESDRQLVANLHSATRRMEDLLEGMRRVAQARDPRHRGQTRLGDALALLRDEFPSLSISAEGGEISLPLKGESAQIILRQFADNASRHGAESIRFAAEEYGNQPLLRISDDGEGVSAGNRDRVFDPFFTTRRETGGTGMGLSIVREMVEAIGGRISLDAKGTGASFTIQF